MRHPVLPPTHAPEVCSAASPETLDGSPRAARRLGLLYAGLMVVLGLFIISTPLATLLDRFMPDDVFYYYNTARIFAHTGFSSFDGLHFTNGYQPLWFLVCVSVFRVFPEGGEVPLRLLMFVQLALTAGATWLMVYTAARRFGVLSTAAGFVVWVVVMQRVMFNGLETALLMFLYAMLFHLYARFHEVSAGCFTRRQLASLGALAGLTFLARTDTAFLIVGLCAALLISGKRAWRARLASLVYFALPLAILAGGYLVLNLSTTGHLMPVSGAAKIFHCRAQRDAAIAATGSAAEVYGANVLWFFRQPHQRYIAVGALAPWLLWLLSYMSPLRERLRLFRLVWPFAFGAMFAWLFYALVFYGGFSRTPWYYGPHAFLACLSIAGLGSTLDHHLLRGIVPGLSAALLAALVLDWLSPLHFTLAAAAVVLFVVIISRATMLPERARRGVLVLLSVAWLIVLIADGVRPASWVVAVLVSLGLVALLRRRRQGFSAALCGAAAIVGATGLMQLKMLLPATRRPPNHWNYNLYRGALWARDNLPLDATICSGSTGVLGYFSQRTAVNTDGLANSYDFLENVLIPGRLIDYYRRWGFSIDAFPDEALAEIFPEGRFLPLPRELESLGFEDGGLRRRLRVFQMDSGGRD